MTHPIINIADLTFFPWGRGEKYEAKMGNISSQIGARKLGYNLTVLPPGKCAFPLHNHRVNEEMFYIIEGSGNIRIGDESHPIREGDVIACPPGGKETAHQIENTSQSVLKFLALGTRETPEIAEYPDSGKVGIYGEFPQKDGKAVTFRFINNGKTGTMDDYWEGEA